MNNEAAYWIAMAHLPRWGHLKINNLIIKFYHEKKISIEDFFHLNEKDWENQFGLALKDIEDLKKAKSELANNSFLAESLYNEGYDLIPIVSPEYSKALKENLKATHAPALLYVKGSKQIMCEKSIAIVGSRNASAKSLEFTDRIAKLASKEYKVIVSGFAAGVDKQALDSAIKYTGQSIIVLPQGIMTFGSGYKKYYKQIVNGDVLVLSTFFPKAPWRAELAMARNPIIYGLADEIFVAESSEKGGTWSGVIDGLRKNRKIYVRAPEENENTANGLLIEKGAVAVDFNGIPVNNYSTTASIPATQSKVTAINYENNILELLRTGEYTVKDILKRLQLSWTEKKLRDFLKDQSEIETIKKSPLKFTIRNSKLLFD
jgi:predicted Rossmann fold nucleotide-binding protein DprA/Smf involved in DNA uptake